jgi:4-amino-4-deoxy-L-arabinose transferase-like glycosyltransferase
VSEQARRGGRLRAAEVASRIAVFTAALWFVSLYLVLACRRLAHPFELEWMEGGAVDHVARVLHGQGLYVRPALDFIPYEYPPLYFYVSAAVARLTGLGFVPLRLVSFVSSLIVFATVYELVRLETSRRLAGVVAVGLFAATFRLSGAWLDIGRVDSLLLALFLAAVLVLRRSASRLGYLTAGILFGLSFLTKQTALAMCLPLVAWTVLTRPELGVYLLGALTAVIALSSAALQFLSRGWYAYYVFQFPFRHAWAKPVLLTFWTEDLLRRLPIACTVAVMGLFAGWRRRPRSLFFPALAVGMVGGAFRSRVQTGGYDNVLLPAYAIVAMLLGLAVAAVPREVEAARAGLGRWVEVAVSLAALAQMIALVYDPRAVLPRDGDRQAGDHVVRVLSGMTGDVFVPYHGYLSTRAGKRPHAHVMQVFDVLKIHTPESEALAAEHRAAIRESRFAAIVLDDGESYPFRPEVERWYVLERQLFDDPKAFLPVTGLATRPQYVYVPRPDGPHGDAGRR